MASGKSLARHLGDCSAQTSRWRDGDGVGQLQDKSGRRLGRGERRSGHWQVSPRQGRSARDKGYGRLCGGRGRERHSNGLDLYISARLSWNERRCH